jgi:hypothetical protein
MYSKRLPWAWNIQSEQKVRKRSIATPASVKSCDLQPVDGDTK